MSSAPYVSQPDLVQRPLGVSWTSLGQQGSTTPSPTVSTPAINQICRVASNQVDAELGQTVRCLFVTEVIRGPGPRMGFLTGNPTARAVTSWSPIRKVLGGAVAATAQLNKTFTTVAAGGIYSESPPVGFYGTNTPEPYHPGVNALLVAPPYVNWSLGRYGIDLHATYLSGWPHAALTAAAAEGDRTLTVDDVTGFVTSAPWINDGPTAEATLVTGATGPTPAAWSAAVVYTPGTVVTYGGSEYQAFIATGPVTQAGPQTPSAGPFWSTVIEPAGPGTLTLAAPLASAHAAATIVTAVPESILWAACLYGKAQALQRGLATLTLDGDGKVMSIEDAILAATRQAVAELVPYRRII